MHSGKFHASLTGVRSPWEKFQFCIVLQIMCNAVICKLLRCSPRCYPAKVAANGRLSNLPHPWCNAWHTWNGVDTPQILLGGLIGFPGSFGKTFSHLFCTALAVRGEVLSLLDVLGMGGGGNIGCLKFSTNHFRLTLLFLCLFHTLTFTN